MNKIEKEIEQYFEEKEIVELSPQKQEQLRNLVKLNKKRKKTTIFKRASIIASTICIFIFVLIPTIVFLNKNTTNNNPQSPPEIFYGDDEAIKIDLQVQDAQAIIAQDYSQYNFIFDEFNFTKIIGFYNPDNNNLLALQIKADEINAPYTSIEINLITSKQFVFDSKVTYLENATYSETDNYKLYKKSYEDMFTESLQGYAIFKNYELYLNLNLINETLFNRFL